MNELVRKINKILDNGVQLTENVTKLVEDGRQFVEDNGGAKKLYFKALLTLFLLALLGEFVVIAATYLAEHLFG